MLYQLAARPKMAPGSKVEILPLDLLRPLLKLRDLRGLTTHSKIGKEMFKGVSKNRRGLKMRGNWMIICFDYININLNNNKCSQCFPH